MLVPALLAMTALAGPVPPLVAQGPRGGRNPAGSYEKILRGLEEGVQALKALGKEEEATRLAAIAGEVRKRLERLDVARRDRKQRVGRQLEALFAGVRILAEEGHPRAADALKRMLLARKMRLAGRRDAEAMEVYRSQPEPKAQMEGLRLAARLWAGRGHETKAHLLARMAEQIARRAAPAPGQGRARSPEGGPELRERVQRLEAEVRRLGRVLERLQAARRPDRPGPAPSRRPPGTVRLL